eukprot:gene30794-biopygen16632
MVLQNSGPIKLSDLAAQFGQTAAAGQNLKLSEYRRGGAYGVLAAVGANAAAPNVPSNNYNIKMSDFYGAYKIKTLVLNTIPTLTGTNTSANVTFSMASYLVSDGQADGADWVVFNFTQDLNGDFDGKYQTTGYFGGESASSGGSMGTQELDGYIYGWGNNVWNILYKLPLGTRTSSFNHTNGNWFMSGGTVTSGYGKYSDFDSLNVTDIGFGVSSRFITSLSPVVDIAKTSIELLGGTLFATPTVGALAERLRKTTLITGVGQFNTEKLAVTFTKLYGMYFLNDVQQFTIEWTFTDGTNSFDSFFNKANTTNYGATYTFNVFNASGGLIFTSDSSVRKWCFSNSLNYATFADRVYVSQDDGIWGAAIQGSLDGNSPGPASSAAVKSAYDSAVSASNQTYGFGSLDSDGDILLRGNLRISETANIYKGAAQDFSAYVRNGELFVYGRNDYGQLGLGHTSNTITVPTKVPGINNASLVACGEGFTLCVRTDGTAISTGLNDNGQLGIGSIITCGLNVYGQLGNNTTSTETVSNLFVNFTGQHRCFVDALAPARLRDHEGLVVVTDKNAYASGLLRGRQRAMTINQALPLVSLSKVPKDPRAFGVISLTQDHPAGPYAAISGTELLKIAEQGDVRVQINSIGEGCIWVCDETGSTIHADGSLVYTIVTTTQGPYVVDPDTGETRTGEPLETPIPVTEPAYEMRWMTTEIDASGVSITTLISKEDYEKHPRLNVAFDD